LRFGQSGLWSEPLSLELDEQTRATAERVARESYGKLVAFLAARTRDVAGAEDALSDAFAAALADWPKSGIPNNPEGWLMAVARRKQIDAARHRQTGEAAVDQLRFLAPAFVDGFHEDDKIPDERLALMFACAHPAIDAGIRAPLMLQTVLGFDASAIASAFLVSPTTMGQRLVRAKTKIKQAAIPFLVPDLEELPERLEAVLDAIYAAYAEGWTDPTGTDARRRNHADEALWLGRLVVSLLPDQPEALGLLSLMLHSHARRKARRNDAGEYVPLAEQDPGNWDALMMDEADSLLRQAAGRSAIGRYQLEAAVQSAHVVRRHGRDADWEAIEQLYNALSSITGSPVVAINHAVAVAQTRGAAAGLALLDQLGNDDRLAEYQPYWAARADLLARTGDRDAADLAFQRAIGLERDHAVSAFLQRRREAASRFLMNDPR
jgi:RNA polymerase sigma-70 factor (ECF subfamily)